MELCATIHCEVLTDFFLQCYLDDGHSFHNTRSLLFVDLQGKPQEAVLDHVELEGQKLRQQCEFTRENGALLKVWCGYLFKEFDSIQRKGATIH